jgi:hypothetical protein
VIRLSTQLNVDRSRAVPLRLPYETIAAPKTYRLRVNVADDPIRK